MPAKSTISSSLRSISCRVISHDAAIHIDILTGGHLVMEAGADLQKGGDAATVGDMAGGRAVVDLADLQVGVLTAHNGGLPPAVDVVLEGTCANQAEAVLLADVIKFYCGHNFIT